jgi:8-oxo-dGTP diphosphatase
MESQITDTLRHPEKATTTTRALMEVSVASVVFSYHSNDLFLLAIKLPDLASWTLPRHSFQSGIGLTDAATLAVKQIAHLPLRQFHQIGATSTQVSPNSNAALEIGFLSATWTAGDDITLTDEARAADIDAVWLPITSLNQLTVGSRNVVEKGLSELRRLSRFDHIIFSLLPPEFSLSELQHLFETLIGRSIDVRNFRKKIDAMNILVESHNKPRGMAHRPPRLFEFSSDLYEKRMREDPEMRFF